MISNITKSVVSGAAWSGISQAVGQSVKFVSVIILARILSPDDFGLLAMVAIVTSVAGNLIDVGFIEAVVQRRELTEKHLVTVFWVMLITGISLCIIVVAISPLIAHFFNNQQVGPLLAVSSVIFIIQSSGGVHSALLRRRLHFFKASMADIGDAIGYMVGVLPSAYFGLGVWSLVIGNITGCIPGVTLRWILSGWRPSFCFSIQSLKDLWKFGINNLSVRLVYVILDRLDSLVIGRFLLPSILGFYSQALKLAKIPSDTLGTIGNRIGLPALAIVQSENQRLQRGLLKGESFLAIIGIPTFVGIAVTAPELVRVILGSQWTSSILPLRILCISGCIAILNIGIPAVFLAKGRPDINLKLSIIQLVLFVPLLLVGVRYGAEGVAIAVSGVSVISWLIRQKFVHQAINLSFKDYLLSLRPALLASLIMAAAILAIHYALTVILRLPDIALFVMEILCGAGIYIATLKISKAQALNEMIVLLVEMVKPYGRMIAIKVSSSNRKTSKL
jgi:O-antigen/teichoic acid export membrane protein